ncbi:gliding motility lipoprotein GldH [Allomuricauda sp. SCSIO 65647]|uniref:gliding motility lipoprotein GldH n=1 Tax=Allomuricauda sp. SCSIO 65647 TaxID=2908843 RepID=UPI001F2EAB65|nr:gliding motility lipoprotein GldH [Muricauda sp. SCSIO 65647]UJH68989.1 gliding motility lipoprotein GldH [Muricauda sp. SCSIO 65647]
MLKKFLCTVVVSLLFSCNNDLIYSDFESTANGKWQADDTIAFQFTGLDTLQHHDMFINIRNNDEFPFSNLFLITEMELPQGQTTRDTLEFEMARPDGKWLGTGQGSIKENKLWYKENIVFRDTGVYKVRVMHAMRKNGNVKGIEALEGITDVGLTIEKSKR